MANQAVSCGCCSAEWKSKLFLQRFLVQIMLYIFFYSCHNNVSASNPSNGSAENPSSISTVISVYKRSSDFSLSSSASKHSQLNSQELLNTITASSKNIKIKTVGTQNLSSLLVSFSSTLNVDAAIMSTSKIQPSASSIISKLVNNNAVNHSSQSVISTMSLYNSQSSNFANLTTSSTMSVSNISHVALPSSHAIIANTSSILSLSSISHVTLSSHIIANMSMTASIQNFSISYNQSSMKAYSVMSSLICPPITTCTPVQVISTIVSFVNFTSYHTSHITAALTSIPALTSIAANLSSAAVIKTSISIRNISSATSARYSSAFVIQPPIEECDAVIMKFSGAIGNLTKCILQHLYPMRICYKCPTEYDALQMLHKEIFKNCGKTLIDNYNEQYQVIPKMFSAQSSTWGALACEKCYKRDPAGGVFSPEFIEFTKLYNKTMNCFSNYSSAEKHNGSKISNTTSQNICLNCDVLYKELQNKYKYYEDSEEATSTPWCADINVAVNETRNLWGSTYKCGKTERDLESIIALTCFFCFLPIVFYVGAKLHSNVKERKTNHYYESD